MRVFNIKPYSEIYGFEPCFVLWMQGCDLYCKGCWSKETWDIHGGYEKSVTELFTQIKSQKESKEFSVQALTILGGEPFLQYEELYELSALVKELDMGLSFIAAMIRRSLFAWRKILFLKILMY